MLKYIDHRQITIPYLTYYPGGLTLPSGDNKIKVTESEKRSLLKKKNGNKDCFEIIRSKEVNDGSRE
jgi:hypothetical protein